MLKQIELTMAVFHLILSCDYDREVNKKKKKIQLKRPTLYTNFSGLFSLQLRF